MGGFRVWGLVTRFNWVWSDKKDPNCDMGFNSDTFTKMLKTAEKLKIGQK